MFYFTTLAAVLFSIGAAGVLIKRNPLVIFMSIELMLNAVNLSFITYSRYLHYLDGQVYAFLLITIAAAEVAVGLAIIVAMYRHKADVDIDAAGRMKG
ncbi:MAG: NADH-quinone oxidoreductase subunit NuoK [bacterium]|jgi:NADH-quinone oxidoreductase subunit K